MNELPQARRERRRNPSSTDHLAVLLVLKILCWILGASAQMGASETPSFTVQPAAMTVDSGHKAQFTALFDGTPPLSLQWTKNEAPVSDRFVSDGRTSLLEIPHARSSDAGGYSLVVSNAWGSITSSAALLIVNPHTPEPFLIGKLDSLSGGGVTMFGHYALVVMAGALGIVDVADPAHPAFIGYYNEQFSQIAIGHGFVLGALSGRSILSVLDLSNPQTPAKFTDHELGGYFTGGLAAKNGYALVTSHEMEDRLQIFNMGNFAAPQLVAILSNVAGALTIVGHYAYAADPARGLQVLDISAWDNPRLVGSSNTIGSAREIAVSGNYVYVTSRVCVMSRFGCAWKSWLEIFDVSDPANPSRVGVYQFDTGAFWSVDLAGLEVSGHYAYVAASYWLWEGFFWAASEMTVLDVSDPSQIFRTGGFEAGWLRDMTISGNYAYLADDGFQILQLAPSVSIAADGETLTIQVAGDTGRPYSLECASSLEKLGSWQPLTMLTLTNNLQTYSIQVSNQLPQRFYRLRALP